MPFSFFKNTTRPEKGYLLLLHFIILGGASIFLLSKTELLGKLVSWIGGGITAAGGFGVVATAIHNKVKGKEAAPPETEAARLIPDARQDAAKRQQAAAERQEAEADKQLAVATATAPLLRALRAAQDDLREHQEETAKKLEEAEKTLQAERKARQVAQQKVAQAQAQLAQANQTMIELFIEHLNNYGGLSSSFYVALGNISSNIKKDSSRSDLLRYLSAFPKSQESFEAAYGKAKDPSQPATSRTKEEKIEADIEQIILRIVDCELCMQHYRDYYRDNFERAGFQPATMGESQRQALSILLSPNDSSSAKSAMLIATNYYPRFIYEFIGTLLRIVESRELDHAMVKDQIDRLNKKRIARKSPEIIKACLTDGLLIRLQLQAPTPRHEQIVSPQRQEVFRSFLSRHQLQPRDQSDLQPRNHVALEVSPYTIAPQ